MLLATFSSISGAILLCSTLLLGFMMKCCTYTTKIRYYSTDTTPAHAHMCLTSIGPVNHRYDMNESRADIGHTAMDIAKTVQAKPPRRCWRCGAADHLAWACSDFGSKKYPWHDPAREHGYKRHKINAGYHIRQRRRELRIDLRG